MNQKFSRIIFPVGILMILVVLLVFSSTSFSEPGDSKTPEPIAYWSLDEGSGDSIEDSIHSYSGDLQVARWSSDCVWGKCLVFDGKDDKVIIPHQKPFNLWNEQGTDFTVVALPDTQVYSDSYPAVFQTQTRWIVDNLKMLNIKFVIHLGDIVNIPYVKQQWERANQSMQTLDGRVPYLVVPGNHDIENLSGKDRDYKNYNTYFPYSRFAKYPWFGGHYPEDSNQNNFGFFKHEGRQFIVLGLNFMPSEDELRWANRILNEHRDKQAIVFTHSYLGINQNKRTGIGEYIFSEVIKHHSNIILVASGHIMGSGAARRVDYIEGQPVNQVLHNCQMLLNGGQGYLRYYTFKLNENKIDAKTYSPYLNKFLTDPDNQFSMDYRKTELTVSTWIKTDTLADQIIVSKQGGKEGSFYLATLKLGGRRIALGITNSLSKVAVAAVVFPYGDNQWHHLAGVYDGERLKIFIDGKLSYTMPSSEASFPQHILPEGLIKNTSLPIEIGSYGGPGWKFKGSIDEVKLFNKALTLDQVTQEYLRHAKY